MRLVFQLHRTFDGRIGSCKLFVVDFATRELHYTTYILFARLNKLDFKKQHEQTETMIIR